jgi:hypothetical protein
MIASEPPDEMESVRGVFTVQTRHTIGAFPADCLDPTAGNEVDGRSSSRKLQHGKEQPNLSYCVTKKCQQ